MSEYVAKYEHIWNSLMNNFQFKATISTILTFLVSVVEILTGLLVTDGTLVAAIIIFLLVDTLTGIWKVCVTKGWRHLSSFGFWSVGIKIIEYSIILFVLTVLSNMDPSLKWVQSWSFIFVGIREVWSIGENLTSIGVTHLIVNLQKTLKSRNMNMDGSDKRN